MLSADTFGRTVNNENDDEYNFDINADFQSVFGGGVSLYSPSIGSFRNKFRDDTMQSRTERTTTGESVRPMTAIAGAGFQSQSSSSDQIGGIGSGVGKVKAEQNLAQKTPQVLAKQFDKEIHQFIEESSALLQKGESFHALQKAETAVRKDNILSKLREKHSLSVQQGYCLTYATHFHLAKVHEANQNYDKAIEVYESLIRQKRFKPYIGRIRINMGNLFNMQEKYSQAIRMYRMALDQTGREDKETRLKILRNIGNTFVKIGKLRDAIMTYEDAVETNHDMKSCFNLITCYIKLGDEEKSKQLLFTMISTAQKIIHSLQKNESDSDTETVEKSGVNEELNHVVSKKLRDTETMLYTAARLVARINKGQTWEDSFHWVHGQLHQKFPQIAFQIEIEQAIEHLQKGEFAAAVKIFKSYENQDIAFKAMVASNLCFVYFLEGNYTVADEYADISLLSNKYNPNALVNKGNCLFIQEEYERAREFYLEAVAIKSTCFEAIYNLALTYVRLGQTSEAMQSFVKLHTVCSNEPRVLYQVANLYEDVDNIAKATKWFNVLSAAVPTDPGVLSRLGQLLLHSSDESQSFHYHLESFRCYPSNIDAIGWLAVWFVKHEMFEKSIFFFHRASQIQPKEIKWKIMVATCHRKMGRDQKALALYKRILKENPESVECLQHLVSICGKLGLDSTPYENELEVLQEDSSHPEISPKQSDALASNSHLNETHESNSNKFTGMRLANDDEGDFSDDDVNVLLS